MFVGILSDTHDRLPTIERALELFRTRRVEAVIHPGDLVAPFAARRLKTIEAFCPLHVIYGNNDGEWRGLGEILPQIRDGPLRLELGGRRVLVHHFINWCRPADCDWAEVIITGHTHEVVNERVNGRLLLNPGECCGWVNGRCTAAVLDTDRLSAEIVEVQA
jgi:putative phosphoesterase